MNIFNETRLKAIFLDGEEIRMAFTIIQVNNLYIRYKSEINKSLVDKVERAKDRHIGVPTKYQVMVKLSNEEMKLMREFNINYCVILADKMSGIEERTGEVDANGIQAYELATRLQLLFSAI